MNGFFHASELTTVRAQPTLIPHCGACKLYRTCKSPKMKPNGKGKLGILIVGEAPGSDEDIQNKQFVGTSGQMLQLSLSKIGIDMWRDCIVTNAAVCRPPNNKLPARAVEYCRPNLRKAIEQYKPKSIILLGAKPVQSLIGWLWKEDPGPIGRWAGWCIPSQRLNCWISPTWHPAYLKRQEKIKGYAVLERMFTKHLKVACRKTERPWKEVPDYKSQVTRIYEVNEAAKHIRQFIKNNKPIAWDLETLTLKPDGPLAEIYSCAVSDGTATIAYPWHGEAIKATKELLVSDVPKIGYNMKFEHRWILKTLGCRVRNWIWDGMLAAHVIDNRPGICGLKFQAFALLGADSYNDVVAPYLTSENGNTRNRIKELNLDKVLTYNGMDALLEYKVAQIQSKKLGMSICTQ